MFFNPERDVSHIVGWGSRNWMKKTARRGSGEGRSGGRRYRHSWPGIVRDMTRWRLRSAALSSIGLFTGPRHIACTMFKRIKSERERDGNTCPAGETPTFVFYSDILAKTMGRNFLDRSYEHAPHKFQASWIILCFSTIHTVSYVL